MNIVIALIFTDASDLLKVSSFTLGFFLLALLLRLIPWFTKAFRLWNWMDFLGHEFSFWDSFRISLMTELGAAISPTAIGGEPIKAGMLYQRGVSFGESASLTSMAAVEDLTFYVLGIPVAIFLSSAWRVPAIEQFITNRFSESSNTLTWILVILAILIIAIVVVWQTSIFQGLKDKVVEFWQDFKHLYESMLKKGKGRFAVNVAVDVIHWGARYSVVSALVLSLGYDADIIKFFVLQWVVFTLMSLVPTPGATGGAEGVFLIIFGPLLPDSAIGIILIGWRFIDFYLVSILALIFLSTDSFLRRKFGDAREEDQLFT